MSAFADRVFWATAGVALAVLTSLMAASCAPAVPCEIRPPAPQLAALSDSEAKLLERFRPHIRQQILSELDSVAGELEGVQGAGGSIFAAALASFIRRAVVAVIGALILSAVVSLLWTHWPHLCAAVATWLGLTALVAWLTARGTRGKP